MTGFFLRRLLGLDSGEKSDEIIVLCHALCHGCVTGVSQVWKGVMEMALEPVCMSVGGLFSQIRVQKNISTNEHDWKASRDYDV